MCRGVPAAQLADLVQQQVNAQEAPALDVQAAQDAAPKPVEPKPVATLCSQPMMMVAIAAGESAHALAMRSEAEHWSGACLTAFGVACKIKKQSKA